MLCVALICFVLFFWSVVFEKLFLKGDAYLELRSQQGSLHNYRESWVN